MAEVDFEPSSPNKDIYGEDRATEDQLVTPWTTSVASGYSLLRNPHHNKGLAFTEKERDAHYLSGLLPPVVLTQALQEKKLMHNIRQYQVPLQKYMALTELVERNERLFYKLLIDNVEELLPIVYTPTVGLRDRPVEFEKEVEEADPFGLDQFLTEVKKGKKAIDKIVSGGTMRASGGGGNRDSGYEGSSRSQIA